MTITKTLFLACATLLMSACSNNASHGMDQKEIALGYSAGAGSHMERDAAPVTDATEKSLPAEPKMTEQKLIKNGDISFETKSIKDTKSFLQKTVSKYKGYISNEKIQDYRTDPTEVLTVRVPNQDFDKLINDIGSQVGEFDSKRIDIDDVTAEFVDMEARLKNKKQLETKYQELLAKANNMADILKIEKEISLIREDIESTEGRLRYLSNQVGYSTLTITYYEKKATAGFHFGSKIGNALSDGGTGFLWFLIGVTQLWPLWLIGGLIWYIIYKVVKRRKK
ncbi:MAG: DUF4349 domain-containing protein [Bacteroidota bacterium]